jgi:hypothetical protein
MLCHRSEIILGFIYEKVAKIAATGKLAKKIYRQ